MFVRVYDSMYYVCLVPSGSFKKELATSGTAHDFPVATVTTTCMVRSSNYFFRFSKIETFSLPV